MIVNEISLVIQNIISLKKRPWKVDQTEDFSLPDPHSLVNSSMATLGYCVVFGIIW